MWRVLVRSRRGNLVLAFVGAVYAVAAIAVLAWLVVDVWHSTGLIDLILQIALVAAAACGVWFVLVAMQNLGVRVQRGQRTAGASNAASVQR